MVNAKVRYFLIAAVLGTVTAQARTIPAFAPTHSAPALAAEHANLMPTAMSGDQWQSHVTITDAVAVIAEGDAAGPGKPRPDGPIPGHPHPRPRWGSGSDGPLNGSPHPRPRFDS